MAEKVKVTQKLIRDMQNLTLSQPKRLVLGAGVLDYLVDEIKAQNASNPLVVVDPFVAAKVKKAFDSVSNVEFFECSGSEPTFSDFNTLIEFAKKHKADFVAGIGGGSVLDLAKLAAALVRRSEPIHEFVGNGLVGSRPILLACVPTTSGAGSESSPNSILIDESDNSKKGIIDKALMPDFVFIDPNLMTTLPANISAYTGLDALTHCIEAYANKNAHPVIDNFALEGVRLISQYLPRVIENGEDLEARSRVALGAYYGGMCLGPVNTAAVHALAYPLGTKYKLAHGLTNAILLPYVLEFNLEAAPDRYSNIARAINNSLLEVPAFQVLEEVKKLIEKCGITPKMSDVGVDKSSIPEMASEALLIQRLLKNNVREVAQADAISIYQNAY